MIEETNALGQIASSQYDAIGNKTFYQSFGQSYSTQYFYDCSNRLVQMIESTLGEKKGLTRKTSYNYDLKSRCTKTIDHLGNETTYLYDAYGNLLETHDPTYKDELQHPAVTYTKYDAAGRLISKTDANGNTTITAYNAYHAPTLIQHPDGSSEQNIYNLDGTLKIHINTERTETHYTYDVLKRPLTKTIISNGQIQSKEQFNYHGKLLISYTDPDGYTTTYEYDGAGRKIAEEKAGERIQYSYDTLGRLTHTVQGSRISIKEYDLLDRVIEEREEDIQGTILTKSVIAYDNAGNIACKTRFIMGKAAEERFEYDGFNRLIRKIDPLDHITRYTYEEHLNSKKTTYDPLGNILIEIFNKHEKILRKVHQDSNTTDLLTEEMEYDLCGNLISQSAGYTKENNPAHLTVWKWEYDCRHRLIALHEAAHQSLARTTRYSYTPEGYLKELHKPDGTIIEMSYDPLGRKISEVSSDHTLHHTFEYNGQGHLIKASDHISQHCIERILDPFGRILSETLDHALQISSTYDAQGRKTSLKLPDLSLIHYLYDPCYLRAIQRKTSQGQNDFIHYFNTYDLDGHLLSETTPNHETIQHTYDLLGRHISTQSSAFKQKILQFDAIGNVLELQTNQKTSSYAYDDLYHLTSESGSVHHSYLYDALGSRTQKDDTAYTVDDLSQYSHLTYDGNGNLTQAGDTVYEYDALGRLLSAKSSQMRAIYTYDALHRRRTKKVYVKNFLSLWSLKINVIFLYDEYNEIGEASPDGTLQALRILGRTQTSEAGSAIALEFQSQSFIPYHDLFGNVARITALDGTLVEEIVYSAFGDESITTSLPYSNPWRFASKRKDEETNLILFGRRYYDPTLGQWMTPDPAGFVDSFNLYLFVRNNPLAHIDLYGYWAENLSSIQPSWSRPPPFAFSPNNHLYDLQSAPAGHVIHSPYDKPYEPAGLHTVGSGKTNPNLGFGFCNGIMNTLQEAKASASLISEMTGGYNINLHYNPTRGFLADIEKCSNGLKGHHSDVMIVMRQDWDAFFDKNPNGHYIHKCHSGGAIHTKNNLKIYPHERRSRIHVIAIAPATYIDSELCGTVIHFLSEGDYFAKGFSLLKGNEQLRNRNNPHVNWLIPHRDAPKIDHSLNSPTYRDPLKRYMKDLIKEQGGQK